MIRLGKLPAAVSQEANSNNYFNQRSLGNKTKREQDLSAQWRTRCRVSLTGVGHFTSVTICRMYEVA